MVICIYLNGAECLNPEACPLRESHAIAGYKNYCTAITTSNENLIITDAMRRPVRSSQAHSLDTNNVSAWA